MPPAGKTHHRCPRPDDFLDVRELIGAGGTSPESGRLREARDPGAARAAQTMDEQHCWPGSGLRVGDRATAQGHPIFHHRCRRRFPGGNPRWGVLGDSPIWTRMHRELPRRGSPRLPGCERLLSRCRRRDSGSGAVWQSLLTGRMDHLPGPLGDRRPVACLKQPARFRRCTTGPDQLPEVEKVIRPWASVVGLGGRRHLRAAYRWAAYRWLASPDRSCRRARTLGSARRGR